MKRSLSYIFAFLAITSAAATTLAEPIKPTAVIVATGNQLLDDPFALASDGESIAYLTVEADAATLHVRPTTTSTSPEWTVGALPFRPEAIEWLDAQHLLLLSGRRGAVVTIKKGVRALPGEYDAIGATKLDKGGAAIVLRRQTKKAELQVRLVDPDLNELADRAYPVDAVGTITVGKVTIKPITFEDGHRVLVGIREGAFDKQRDMRLPPTIVSVDLAKGKIVDAPDAAEASDPIFLANLTAERKLYANRPRFVTWNAEHTGLQVVDGAKMNPLRWDRNVALYDPDTLQSGTLDAQQLWMAIKVEPLNPIAMEKKRRDADDLEIYAIDRQRLVPERKLVLDGMGRTAVVAVSGQTVAVLRKQKVMARGGVAIEIYPLGAQSRAQVPTSDTATQ